MITFHKYGDQALLINFEQKIDPMINKQVIALKNVIEEASIPGITFFLPAYCSLTIGFDPTKLDVQSLTDRVKILSKKSATEKNNTNGRYLRIPVCYDEGFALDLAELSLQLSLSKEAIVETHVNTIYRVYMLGFLPGFVYMGKVANRLTCKRKQNPRVRVPAQSVGIAGFQTGIYPSEAPGGWQILGKTPISIFDPKRDSPFLFQAGDQVQFYAITVDEFHQLEEKFANHQSQIETLYE